ncbi:MAG: hypothetical protein QOG03_495 [Actinomycetota bacterium]|nr:hypothetical protein [Actinomycetota bacterium]
MTEIPEHLLRRSRERREALGLAKPGEGGDDAPAAATPPAGDEGEGAAVPATTTAAAPAAAAAPVLDVPAEPEPPSPQYIALQAQRRNRIPMWVMPVLVFLPFWGVLYFGAFGSHAKKQGPVDPLVLGAQIYKSAGCTSCHGANGEGGVGPKLTGGEAVLTFPDEADQISWVRTGSSPFAGKLYGDPNRTGGQHGPAKGVMPAFTQLSDTEVKAVVKYEREKL